MFKIKQWAKSIFSKNFKKKDAMENTYFICNEEQSCPVRFLLSSENFIFSELVNSLELGICDNEEKGIIIQGKTSKILEFIHAMRAKFKISAFQEYIDVSRININ